MPDLFASAPEPDSAIGAAGHRMRMRQRLLRGGPDALADHEMLEMALFLALPRRDTKPVARALLARFGDFAAVIGAPSAELLMVPDLGEAGVAALKLVQAAAARLLKQKLAEAPVLSDSPGVLDYLRAVMGQERVEQFRILFLNNRNRLLADEVQSRGSVAHAPAYPREVVRRALELNATALILAHNHPSGDPTPSREDVAMTQDIQRAAATMGIVVHDHIVVGRTRCVSLRAARLL
ncbi:RadC family protein [Rhodopila sp.]|uniref:RadC family protein n=1 Tax=Rhodopila sp. TaxID=2480087 RepID=UPI002D808EF7|nr:DNA repair protein RadC [Rhodopila sp.]